MSAAVRLWEQWWLRLKLTLTQVRANDEINFIGMALPTPNSSPGYNHNLNIIKKTLVT